MANIITSKTRSKIMRQPHERAKALTDRRAQTFDRHSVQSVTPTVSLPEEAIHEELDRQGSGVAEAMEANQEREQERIKKKQMLREEKRQAVSKKRLELLKERDRVSGVEQRARKFRAENTSYRSGK